MGAAHDPPQRARRTDVVRRRETSAGRDVRPGPGGDERHRPPPQRSIAGGRKEPGHQRRPIESLRGRTPIAIGIVDARRRGVLRVPHRRCQRHQPLAGAQHRSRARDGRSRGARSECRTDRAAAAHRKRRARRRLGIDRHTARLGRHSAHPCLRPWQLAASERSEPRSPRPRLGPGHLSSGGNPGGTGAGDDDHAPRPASVRRGGWQKCLGRSIQPSNPPRPRGGGVCAGDRSARRRRSARPKLVVREQH